MLLEQKSALLNPLRSLPWKTSHSNACQADLIDMEWLSSQPMLPFLVPLISPQLLYRSLMAHGMEDSLDVIQWIQGKQLHQILDYDVWEYSKDLQTPDIGVGQILNWIRLWLEIGSEFAAERFFELEEELIVLALTKLFEIMPVGINSTVDDMCDGWDQTPDKRFFIKSSFQEMDDDFYLLKSFVAALYATDLAFAGSVFSYAAMLIRDEALEEGVRWRAGRLADQGFVSKEEALKTLGAKKRGDLKKIGFQSNFNIHNAHEDEHDAIVKLLSKMEPEEGIHFMTLALTGDALKEIAGNSDTSIEHFYQDEDFLLTASKQVLQKCQNMLTAVMSKKAQESMPRLLIENVFSEFNQSHFDIAVQLKERLARIANTMTSVSEHQFDEDTISRSLEVSRGFLNIGLEICLAIPSEFGLCFESNANEIEKGVACLQQAGPEFIFQIGWNAVINLINQIPRIKLENALDLPSETQIALSALKNMIPMFPKLWDGNPADHQLDQSVRPFETFSDLEKVKLFVKSLEH